MAEQDVTDAFLEGDGDTPAAPEQVAVEDTPAPEESPSDTSGGDESVQEPGAQAASPETPDADKPVDYQKRHADAEKKLNEVLAERDKLKPQAAESEALKRENDALRLATKMATEPEVAPQDGDAALAKHLVTEEGFTEEEAKRYIRVNRKVNQPGFDEVKVGQRVAGSRMDFAEFVRQNPEWKKHEADMAQVVADMPYLKQLPNAAGHILNEVLRRREPETRKALEAQIREDIAKKRAEAGSAPNVPGESTGPTAAVAAKSESDQLAALFKENVPDADPADFS